MPPDRMVRLVIVAAQETTRKVVRVSIAEDAVVKKARKAQVWRV